MRYRLGQLPADEIENWLNDEIAAGIAPSSVHRHYRTLRRMLQVAVQKQKILTNPCDRVDPPRVPKREMTFLDWDKAIWLAEAHNERYRALIYVAVDTGCAGASWSVYAAGRSTSAIARSESPNNSCSWRTGQCLRKEPKTSAGVRSITHLAIHRRAARRRTSNATRARGRTRWSSRTPRATRCRRRAS